MNPEEDDEEAERLKVKACLLNATAPLRLNMEEQPTTIESIRPWLILAQWQSFSRIGYEGWRALAFGSEVLSPTNIFDGFRRHRLKQTKTWSRHLK